MDPMNFEKLEAAINAAAEVPASERQQWLNDFCDDDALRAEIESFWRAEADASSFLENTVGAFAAAALNGHDRYVPRQLGNYTIIREVGAGGMGAVFLAERSDGQFDQHVAIKIVRQTIAEEALLTQFKRERQILASLNHPNIAKLVDGGLTETGEPFLVMEYIEGDPILEYVRKEGLGLEARLRLFISLCKGVSYAHRNLVVHRDIKPSNILVDTNGVPKLLDFGLAKVVDETMSLGDRTQTAVPAMTPAYASPEQLRGETVTTATDVYSLGTVLYELLTGKRPYKLSNYSFDEVMRALSTKEPTVPSDNRGSRDDDVLPVDELRGDLDNVILMALRKDPERRYASVEQFADDIKRYLDGKTVSARSDTLRYRASKFVKRHVAAVTGAILVAITIMAGSGFSIWQARRATIERERAERRFNDIRELSNSLMFEIHDSVKDLPGSTPTRELIVRRALEYLDRLAQEAGEDPSLMREMAAAYVKIGDIQGNPYGANLGNLEGAKDTYGRALAIYENLLKAAPQDAEVLRAFAGLLDKRGEIALHASDTAGGLEAFQRSLAIREQVAALGAPDPTFDREIAVSRMKIGEALQKIGKLDQAVEYTKQAIATFASIAERDPENIKAARDVMIASNKLGYVYFVAADLEASLALYREGLATSERLAAKSPDNAVTQRDLSICLNNVARILLRKGDAPDSVATFQRSLEISRRMSALDPQNDLARSDVAYVLVRLGAAQLAAGDLDAALASEREALTINSSSLAANPKHTFTISEIGDVYGHIGDIMEKRNDLEGAVANYARAVAEREKLANLDKSDAQYQLSLAETYQHIGKLAGRLGRDRDGAAWTEKSLSLWQQLQDRGAVPEASLQEITEAKQQLASLQKRQAPSSGIVGVRR